MQTLNDALVTFAAEFRTLGLAGAAETADALRMAPKNVGLMLELLMQVDEATDRGHVFPADALAALDQLSTF